MLKINDWADNLLWAGIVLVLLGITIDAMLKYELTLEGIIASKRQEEWSWGLGISIAGLVVLMISLALGIADIKRSERRVRNNVKNK